MAGVSDLEGNAPFPARTEGVAAQGCAKGQAAPGAEPSSPEEAADFLVDMIRELEEVARRHGHEVLGQILAIAHLEALRSAPLHRRPAEMEAG